MIINPDNIKVAEWTPEGLVIEPQKSVTTDGVSSINELKLSDPIAGTFTLEQLADKIKESIGINKGDMLVFIGPKTIGVLPAPEENNMILVSDNTTETGLIWKRLNEVIQ